MTAAREAIAEILCELDCLGKPDDIDLEIADAFIERLLAKPESVRLELAALLNPWRPGPPPEYPDMPTDGIEITLDRRWRYLLPAAPQLEDKLK